MADAARAARARRVRRRRLAAAATGLVLVGAGSAVAVAATTGGTPGRRLATVGRATVTEVVDASGTVTAASEAAPAFAVSGTVRSVAVRIGDAVRAGQVLARLDPAALQGAVDAAGSTLAAARQRLQADETGQSTAAASGATGGSYAANGAAYTALTTSVPVTHSSPSTAASPAASGSSTQRLTAAQQAVVAAQHTVDQQQVALDAAEQQLTTAVTENTALRDAERTACATGSDASTGPATAACASARADYETSADTLSTANAAVAAAVDAQDAAVRKLDAAIAALDALLANVSSSGGSGTSHGGSGAPGGGSGPVTGGSGPSSGRGGSGSGTGTRTTTPTGGGSTGRAGSATTVGSGTRTTPSAAGSTGQTAAQPASAAQLAADQAAIDAAAAEVRAASQNLSAATLRSPITGTVAAVGVTAGLSSAAGKITIVGRGVPKVTAAVPLAQVDLVRVGQPVAVAVDGVGRVLPGTVAAVGLLSSTSGSTTTFPVTVQLAAGTPRVFDGAGADVRITTGTARNVVAVPDSALHTGPRGLHTVTVLRGGTTSTVFVTLGVAGAALTEVRSGLRVGDRVVLADYGQPLPSSSTSSTTANRLGRLLGGFGGGGFGRGGFGGGGFGRASGGG